MTNNEDYENALNDSIKAYRNAVKDKKAEIPQGYGMAFNYGYTFGVQQATAEQKKNSERQLNFQREHIAAAAMQGLLASPTDYYVQSKDVDYIAQYAVKMADTLISELNKPKDERQS